MELFRCEVDCNCRADDDNNRDNNDDNQAHMVKYSNERAVALGLVNYTTKPHKGFLATFSMLLGMIIGLSHLQIRK